MSTNSAAAWAAQQLPEYLALLSACPDEITVLHTAVEWAAELMEAEVGVIVLDGTLAAQTGFPQGRVPAGKLVAVATQNQPSLHVPGVGPCHTGVVDIGQPSGGQLLVARFGQGFGTEELSLLRGMGRVLSLVLRQLGALDAERKLRADYERRVDENERLVRSLRERQRLLEEFSRVQRAIANRAPLRDVLDAITAGAAGLFDGDMVSLRLLDSDDPGYLVLVSSSGLSERFTSGWRLPVTAPGHRHVLATGELLHADRALILERADDPAIRELIHATMIAPVREDGMLVGCLTVASCDPNRRFTETHQETLLGFADHVSLALTDARGMAAVRHAYHDTLTGLPNRALLMERLNQAMVRGRRGLLFVDLDRFKLVNDSLGHEAGDQLLVEVARRLRDAVGEDGMVARFGGDEFVVLIDRDITVVDEATEIAERVLVAMRSPVRVGGRQLSVNASVGVTLTAAGAIRADEALRDADVAMYRAKQQGPGRFEVFQPEMHSRLVEQLELENDLRRAIDQGELRLAYQPILDIRTMRTVAVEALLRWRHPTRGLLLPERFIPLAEETGLVEPLGRWVLGEASRAAVRWSSGSAEGGRSLIVSVNLAASHLRRPEVVAEVSGIVGATGLDLSQLVIEVTETGVVEDVDAALQTLHQLKALGAGIAVDDFGTGFSSLRYLRTLPVDVVKVDQSFLAEIDRSAEAREFARSIMSLGATLRRRTVAEGVERLGQLTELRRMGCRYAQGYYFSQPLSEEELLVYLRGESLAHTG